MRLPALGGPHLRLRVARERRSRTTFRCAYMDIKIAPIDMLQKVVQVSESMIKKRSNCPKYIRLLSSTPWIAPLPQ
jgi:hypothetical protein